MKCPHCLEGFFPDWKELDLGKDATAKWSVVWTTCPSCRKFNITLRPIASMSLNHKGEIESSHPTGDTVVYPRSIGRSALPPEVDESFASIYRQAATILVDSPMASAALSRRCLQHLLRDVASVRPSDLNNEIQQVLDNGNLPVQLSEAIDAVRVIGNFAAHPIKSKTTGEIVEVEAGEAEWNLDVLEAAFDFYFVQPAILKRKRDALNKKLTDAGKPPLK